MYIKNLISIIIPVYKVEYYLEECINSVLNQTYEKCEFILVDDGSPDSCGNICDKYAIDDMRVKVIHKENGGLSDARNAGIEVARGEYITFIDSDDYVAADYLETLVSVLEEEKADIVQCQYTCQTKRLGTVVRKHARYLSSEESLKDYLLFKNISPSACMKLYRRKLFENIRFPKGRINEDTCTTYKLLWQSKKYICIGNVLYYYRIRKSSIMHANFSAKRLEILNVPDEMRCYLGDKGEKYVEEIAYYEFRIRFFLYNVMLRERQDVIYKKDILDIRKKIITTDHLKYIDVKYLFLKYLLKYNEAFYKYILLHISIKER